MIERTTRGTVTFRQRWSLPGADGWLPAGSYVVETDEEVISGLSFLAYRRIRTSMIVPTKIGAAAARQVVEIDPEDLAAALARDATTATKNGEPIGT